MKYFTIDLDGKEVKFRLTSSDAQEIEKKTGKSALEVIQSVSNTNCAMILKYMRRGEVPQFSNEDANKLYDELVDNGYSLQSIYMDIIFPACVESGLLTKSDLDRIKEAVNNPQATQNK